MFNTICSYLYDSIGKSKHSCAICVLFGKSDVKSYYLNIGNVTETYGEN